MKEYHVLHVSSAGLLTLDLNERAKQGWEPLFFAMTAAEDTDTFGVVLVRESREPGTIKAKLGKGRPA
jgi:hypothetical protein